MNGTLRDGVVRLSDNARQRFYDSGGYGRPAGGVRKRMVFALTEPSDGIDWLCVERITP